LVVLQNTTGGCLRIDHTYKFASILGGWSKVFHKWVSNEMHIFDFT